MLEVILQNTGGQRRTHLPCGLNRADDFSAANHFRSRQSRNFRREHEIDFKLYAGLENVIAFK